MRTKWRMDRAWAIPDGGIGPTPGDALGEIKVTLTIIGEVLDRKRPGGRDGAQK